ncbi:hypothetical protein [Marinomonas transparens]|uniref:Uncharacterized protein n=1 Tax=Marinomonas transparens TaxID=2795388 RepID=A0A934JSW2_9GAMM|nr:hypothetical protein [Marinomonas transparens]MBJ7536457.1 hypothetical protein [Marinomonas transparens]
MSKSFVSVPIRIEGKYLQSSEQAESPMADFSQLPWYSNDKNQDVNFNHPFSSKTCLRRAFQTPNTMLEKGVHLHFIVPHYLGRKVPKSLALANSGHMPAAPNRWIISRKTSENASTSKQWYLESDYIYPEEYSPESDATTIPYPNGKPYRYMGKCSPLVTNGTLPTESDKNLYFKGQNNGKPLTILGYGDVNFSSYYPNCNSVFGFHDPDGNLDASTTYSVIGWHGNNEDDLLYQTITAWLTSTAEQKDATLSEEALAQKLKNTFGLELEGSDSAAISQAIPSVFYGEFIADAKQNSPEVSKVKVAVGQTGTEALSSLIGYQLSQKINKDQEQAKSIIEDQLESVLMFSQLDDNNIDVGAKFNEARHSKGFRPSNGVHKWTIQTKATDSLPTDSDSRVLPSLPQGIGRYLHDLNDVQLKFHNATQEIATLQKQLYADWNKYMQARYPANIGLDDFPDADHIQYFITNYSIGPIQQKMQATGDLSYDQSHSWKPTTNSKNPIDLAHQVIAKWQALDTFIQNENTARTTAKEPLLILNRIEGPRFWEAKSPTVLLSGLPEEQAAPNNLISLSDAVLNGSISVSLPNILQALKGMNTQKLSTQIWTPFLLDWQFSLNPAQLKQGKGMDSESLLNSFNLEESGPDFKTSNQIAYTDTPAVFSGTVVLSTHTKNTQETAIKGFFKNLISKEKLSFAKNKATPPENNTLEDFFNASKWSDASVCFEKNDFIVEGANTDTPPNVYYVLWQAYQTLQGQQFLSQTLDGFYEACRQLDKVAQLPIREPIGFTSDQNFTEQVKETVGRQRGVAPEIAFEFNPIPCGLVDLERLNLIDNFGQSVAVNVAGHIPFSDTLTVNEDNATPYLKPRLAQPAQLNFNWMKASTSWDSVETPTNDDTATSPICGWLMNNYLDNNIAIYDAAGHALGYIDDKASWNAVPWNTGASNINADIQNTHLYNVAQKIMASAEFMGNFMQATQNAQHNIAPQNAQQHSLKSRLVGKPIAVVRAAVGLQLKGLPAIDQSWPALMQDLDNCNQKSGWGYGQRYKDNWTSVQFPCRLGEHRQLNDGLIGYWTESPEGLLSNTFIAPQTTNTDGAHIEAYTKGGFQDQPLVLNAEPLMMTMLMDPHGLIHATTGILPTKALSIPEKHYLPALQKLKVWFASKPLIQAQGQDKTIQLNLPNIPDMQWQWWDPYNGTSRIEKYVTNTQAPSEIKEGWILLENNLNH